MFMLWAIPLGIGAGLVAGGRMAGLSALRFRWGWLAVLGLVVQVALFTPTGDAPSWIAGLTGSTHGPPVIRASWTAHP